MHFPRARVPAAFPRLRTDGRRTRRRNALIAVLLVGLVGGVIGLGAIATNTMGAGRLFERFVAKVDGFLAGPPPPDRVTEPTLVVTPRPASPSANPTPTLPPAESGKPPPTPAPTPTPIPRVAVDVDILKDHEAVFAHELHEDWCSPAGVSMVLAILDKGAPTEARQRELASRIHEWETYSDSHNLQWGPSAMVKALSAYGAVGYRVVAYETRADALRGAASAISTTNSPAILLAWRGAHTWIMTGYRANADPSVFDDAKVSGTYILDPWFPWNSSIWGQSDPPGTFQDASEMVRNFLAWKRPEGLYPGRDGNFIVVQPTVPRT
ncbi:MAG: hypothetical protein H0V73_06350 [Chloroflexi bacterium]|nr:hypothetical protein [Chloroflexota bacterium]